MGNKLITNCKVGKNTEIYEFVNLYDCEIGDNCLVGTFVEIQKNVVIGNNSRIQSHSFICDGIIIEDNVFIGHHVVFTNDKYPKVNNKNWKKERSIVKSGASIGSNSTIVGPVTIGINSLVGAGSVVTHNVPDNTVVAGNPARVIKMRS